MAALTAVSAVVLLMTPRVAGAVTWSALNPPMPGNAVAGQGATLPSVSCPADGWCVAVGDYLASSTLTYYDAALIESESGGSWTATQALLPVGASTTDSQALLNSVQCAAVGSCVAVGHYVDSSGATQALVETLAGGIWTPNELTLPGDASTSGSAAFAQLTTLECPTGGWCVAVGVYSQTSGGEQAFVATDTGGSWSAAAVALPIPASGSQLLSASCPAVGSCVATGTYEVGGTYSGLVETLSGGTWTGTTLTLPAGTSSAASIANNDLSVTCPAVETCVVAGTTFDGNYEGLLDTLSGGTWTASAVSLPGGVTSPDVQLTSVACTDAADCVATGLFSAAGVEQGLVDTLGSGSWTASIAPVPAGTLPATDIDVLGVSCPSVGACVAEGQSDNAGTVNGLFWNLSSGTTTVTPAPLPADAQASSDPAFAPFTCPATGDCLSVGTYLGSSGRESVVESDPSLPATTTTVSAKATSAQTTSYSATVTGSTPPTGTVVFSAGLDSLCRAPVVAGSATCTGPASPTPQFVGSYSGDGSNAPSWGTGASPPAPAVPSTIADLSTPSETAKVDAFFPSSLSVEVISTTGIGVAGVPVTFVAPSTGASVALWGPATVLTNAAGIATSPPLEAIDQVGSYIVWAHAGGVQGIAAFVLTNKHK